MKKGILKLEASGELVPQMYIRHFLRRNMADIVQSEMGFYMNPKIFSKF